MTTTEVDKLKARMLSSGIRDIKPFIDLENPPTPEKLASEILSALDQLESGEYEVVE